MTTLVDRPNSDRGVLSFYIPGTRVRVYPWFWLTTLIAGAHRDLGGATIWAAVCFVSILLHELGHVAAFRLYGVDSEAILYGFGGLATPQGEIRGCVPKVVVAFAGPLAGFCVTALVAAGIALTGGQFYFTWYLHLPHLSRILSFNSWEMRHIVLYSRMIAIVNDLLFVNFYWGVVNLLPVWPLDGGHISRALCEAWNRTGGRHVSLVISAVVAVLVAVTGANAHNIWIAVMFGMCAFSSFQALQGATASRPRPIPAYRRYRQEE